MDRTGTRYFHIAPSCPLLILLYLGELLAVLGSMALYKRGDISFSAFLSTRAGYLFSCSVFVLLILVCAFILLVRKENFIGSSRTTATIVVNIWGLLFAITVAEILVRAAVVATPAGPAFAGTVLLPRSWISIAEDSRASLTKASAWGSYFVYDSMLGWVIGKNRRSRDGLYFSSVEGIRSSQVDAEVASVAAAKRRVAIVGDSFTFGLEVPYDQTWGHQLERSLGPEYRVLNFGVDGYGIDQSFLRYRRDIVSWKPEIVIFGAINDDFRRTMGVYGFLTFQSGMPFPKPRLILQDKALVPVNYPLPTPETLFVKGSIAELPFIEYDASYQRSDWEWQSYHNLYTVRYLISRFPRWPRAVNFEVTDEAMRNLNAEILRAFLKLASENSSRTIIVYFPSKPDFESAAPRVAKEVLGERNLPYVDMTECVSNIDPQKRFLERHYSPVTNTAVARCLHALITSQVTPRL